jgi:hypothetical protein
MTPFCGFKQDNVYTFGPSDKSGGDGILGSTTGLDDSVLLPTAEQGKPK